MRVDTINEGGGGFAVLAGSDGSSVVDLESPSSVSSGDLRLLHLNPDGSTACFIDDWGALPSPWDYGAGTQVAIGFTSTAVTVTISQSSHGSYTKSYTAAAGDTCHLTTGTSVGVTSRMDSGSSSRTTIYYDSISVEAS